MNNKSPQKCESCDALESVKCKRTFLGFTKCTCTECGKITEQPLGLGYSIAYWVIGIWLSLSLLIKLPLFLKTLSISGSLFISTIAEHLFIILFAVGAFSALKKNARIKQSIESDDS